MNHQVTNELRELITELFDRHGAALVLYARQWCRFPDDALQEAFIELSRQALIPRDPVAWLYITVKRRAINLARSELRRQNHQKLASARHDLWFEGTHTLDHSAEDLQRRLTELPELDREVIVARIWGELTFEQIATLVESSSSAVHRQYHAALQKLRDLIETNEQPHNTVPVSKVESHE